MVFFSPAVAGPRPSKASDESVLTISDRRCGSNVGASPGGAARAGDSASVIESESSEAARRVMAYPWRQQGRSEEHTSELQSLMRISSAVFCLKKKKSKY